MAPRERALKQAFDLTLAEWILIWEYQGKVCFICQRPIELPRKPHTDHSHKTGHVRGILCSQCNRALGKAEDPRWQWTARHFTRAGLYLASYPATEALGRVIQGFPGKIGTLRYRTWLADKENRPRPKRKGRKVKRSS
jgi:hypothetical protein